MRQPLRRRTTSSSIIAMCAAGPPNDVVPSLRKTRPNSASGLFLITLEVARLAGGNASRMAAACYDLRQP